MVSEIFDHENPYYNHIDRGPLKSKGISEVMLTTKL